MDPVVYSPYRYPDFGGAFLPMRYWTGYIQWDISYLLSRVERRQHYVVGVA